LNQQERQHPKPEGHIASGFVSRKTTELVPKPVVLSQALVVFQPAAYKTTFFIGSCSKI
jgi:hypothetical protein